MLRTTLTALLFALTAACSGAEPGPDDAAAQGPCGGEPCPALGPITELTPHVAKVTVPDIKLTAVAAPAGQGFVDGQHLEENEMSGVLPSLDTKVPNELGSIDRVNVGFRRFSDDDAEANSEKP